MWGEQLQQVPYAESPSPPLTGKVKVPSRAWPYYRLSAVLLAKEQLHRNAQWPVFKAYEINHIFIFPKLLFERRRAISLDGFSGSSCDMDLWNDVETKKKNSFKNMKVSSYGQTSSSTPTLLFFLLFLPSPFIMFTTLTWPPSLVSNKHAVNHQTRQQSWPKCKTVLRDADRDRERLFLPHLKNVRFIKQHCVLQLCYVVWTCRTLFNLAAAQPVTQRASIQMGWL